jgi:hypothetical protein
MNSQDAYKLIFQGVFGIGHIMGDSAWGYLECEAAQVDLTDLPDELFLESISLDGEMVRVNLRTWLRKGYNLQLLYNAMILSNVKGDTKIFLKLWDEYMNLVKKGKLNFDISEAIQLDKLLNREKPQARHHSEAYRKAYKPAYRVVLLKELEKIAII